MGPDAMTDVLAAIVAKLPGGGEVRSGQAEMAAAVATAMGRRRHLIVQAGTGTGKSLAYLVPALLSGSRVVVATATKALQDQLATRDLPFLQKHLPVPFEFAVLKGRANYLCRQKVNEVRGGGDQLDLSGAANAPGEDGAALGSFGRQLRRIIDWGDTAETGDRADLPFEPHARAWAMLSVGAAECPGAPRCPSGEVCLAEAARDRASRADVVIVNTHLYATHLAAGGALLPPHDVVIFDEAHELEEVASSSLGLEIGAGRFAALARSSKPLVSDTGILDNTDGAGMALNATIAELTGRRLNRPLPDDLVATLNLCRERLSRLSGALRTSDGDTARKARAQQAAGHLTGHLDQMLALPTSHVAWVEGPAGAVVLKMAPIEIGEVLAALLWNGEDAPTAVLTSATIPPRLALRLGLPKDSWDELDVGSPFDYSRQALLYCAVHLPDPRSPTFEAAMHSELEALIRAAGGRTLALFTSWRAMEAAATALRPRLPWSVLTQSDLPKPALVARFSSDEHSCLFATMGFWQGVDVPGPALSLLTIDRIPFPRPDEPLLQARRERLGRDAFALVDLPRAATLLAQGAGRLIRSAGDSGVVAVLDPRLASANYRWDLVRALPPMHRTRHREEVLEFLAPLREAGGQ